jgi:hypothetical protein
MLDLCRATLFNYAASFLPPTEMQLVREAIAEDGEAKKYVTETRRQILGTEQPDVDWTSADEMHRVQEKLFRFATYHLDEREFKRMLHAVKGDMEVRQCIIQWRMALRRGYEKVIDDLVKALDPAEERND